ncbi:hypothetical protein HXX01_02310 [Candidatus Nomurabacteria bacterium]|nr:hypothetical protein [Candidatus Nomurabacteria bacterium]
MKKTKFSDVNDYVESFKKCESLVIKEYAIKTENRFFITLAGSAIIFVLWGTFVDSIILFILGTVLVVIFVLFLKYPLSRISLYIIDLLMRIRYSGDIAYDVKARRIEIKNELKNKYGSHVENLIAKDNVNNISILEAKKIIDHY